MKTKNLTSLLVLFFSLNFLTAQQLYVNENFNTATLPTGWVSTAISGNQAWTFGLDGSSAHMGNQNLDGSSMAYFDDDALGGGSVNNTASLTTPSFDNTSSSSTTLEFDYNFREFGGSNPPDSFYVQVFDGTTWKTVFSLDTDNCGNYLSGGCTNNYPHANIDISNFANANCQVRFIYFDGNDWGWYVGLDNVIISSPFAFDLELSEIIAPNSGCGLSAAETVQVQIKNIGSSALNTPFTLYFDINNGSQLLVETINSTIPAGGSLNHTFTATADFSTVGNYSVKSYIDYTQDLDASNDTAHRSIENRMVFNFNYSDDFEGTNNWSTSGTNNSWSLGVPSASIINSAVSGTKAYVTNLSGNYNINETSYLVSPCLDFSQSIGNPSVSFDLIYDTEAWYDSLSFEYTTDGGLSWQKVAPSFISSNWYQSGKNYWDGSSSGWIKVFNKLPNLSGQSSVQFRFNFNSDGSNSLEGIGIDNFKITDGVNTDLLLSSITNEDLICFADSIFINAQVANIGIQAIDTTYVFYQINGGTVSSDTIYQAISPGSQLNITSKRKHSISAAGNLINVWVKTPRDTVASNDSILNYSAMNSSAVSYSFPYLENFDSFVKGTVFSNLDDTISNDWQRTSSGFTWRVADGSLNRSTNTGPSADLTGGNFMYSEASSGNQGDEAILTSPCIQMDQSSNITFEFYTHRFGTDIGPLYVELYNGSQWLTLDSIIAKPQTSQNASWTKHQIAVNVIPYSNIKVRFRTLKLSSGFEGDIAIDDIKLYNLSAQDASITAINSPASNCYLSANETVRIDISNNGTADILPNTLSVSYTLNGALMATELITDTIKVNTILSYPFIQQVDLSAYGSVNLIEAFSTLNGDQNTFNDTSLTQVINLTYPANFFEDFENTSNNKSCQGLGSATYTPYLPQGWSDASNSWIVQNTTNCGGFGNSQGATGSASTGPSRPHTGTNFIYLEIDVTSASPRTLETSCFDFVNDSNITLEFWYHKFGSGMGDLFIEVEDFNGQIFTVDSILGQTQPSTTASWLKRTISLDAFSGQQIKVLFRAEIPTGSGRFQGDMALDNIRVFNPLTVSLKEQKVTEMFSLYPNPNNGLFTLNVSNEMIGVSYRIFDMKGSMVKSERINSPTSQIRLDNVDKGFYFIQIEELGKTEKIVIQ